MNALAGSSVEQARELPSVSGDCFRQLLSVSLWHGMHRCTLLAEGSSELDAAGSQAAQAVLCIRAPADSVPHCAHARDLGPGCF